MEPTYGSYLMGWGIAGYGCVLRNAQGMFIKAKDIFFGRASNNVWPSLCQ